MGVIIDMLFGMPKKSGGHTWKYHNAGTRTCIECGRHEGYRTENPNGNGWIKLSCNELEERLNIAKACDISRWDIPDSKNYKSKSCKVHNH